MTPKEFVKALYPHAKAVEDKTGISALFTLAQAALESGWGKYAVGNMYFGIKAGKGYTGKKQLITTTEYFKDDKQGARFPEVLSIEFMPKYNKYRYKVKDWFRAYDSPEGSFNDHADFFFKNSRYAEALNVKHDAYQFAEQVARAGYATAPDYAAKLKATIASIQKLVL